MKKFDLQDRLIDYSVRIINVSTELGPSFPGEHISKQLLRSGTSPAVNYGEAQSAESRSDFIHKLKIALKELRETEVWLKIIQKSKHFELTERLKPLIDETNELISILFVCIETTRKNKAKEN